MCASALVNVQYSACAPQCPVAATSIIPSAHACIPALCAYAPCSYGTIVSATATSCIADTSRCSACLFFAKFAALVSVATTR